MAISDGWTSLQVIPNIASHPSPLAIRKMMSFIGLFTATSLFLTTLAAPTSTTSLWSSSVSSTSSAVSTTSKAAAAATSSSGTPFSSAPILDLGYAKYQGTSNTTSGVNTFNGIYFAQPPVGQLRWQPPLDIELNNTYSSDNVINATVYGPMCLQGVPLWATQGNVSAIAEPPVGAEDCLLLNIQVPINPKSAALPIMVYIHGGGYTEGSSQTSGDVLITASNGSFIFVSVQYRLGAYGFLANSEIKKGGVGNAGLLDQRAAIRWVQRNAASFGGDPNAITINGGSAGGGSVMSQLILYGGEANPPFRAAISEFPWWQPFKSAEVLEAQYRYLLQAAGCNSLSCLRSLDETTLAIASQKVYINAYKNTGGYGYGDFYFGPAVDGVVIQDLPSQEFRYGHFAKVPVLVDHDEFEAVPFSNTSTSGLADELADLQHVFPNAKQSFWDRIFELYPVDAYNSTFYHRAAVFGDVFVDCPTYWLASAMTDWGLPVYKLLFYAGTELHGATGPYILGQNGDGTYMANDTIGAYMKDWFASFTTHMDPNAVSYSGLQKPNWPLYNDKSIGNDGFNAMNVNFTQIGVVRDFDVSPKCDFLHGQSQVTWN